MRLRWWLLETLETVFSGKLLHPEVPPFSGGEA